MTLISFQCALSTPPRYRKDPARLIRFFGNSIECTLQNLESFPQRHTQKTNKTEMLNISAAYEYRLFKMAVCTIFTCMYIECQRNTLAVFRSLSEHPFAIAVYRHTGDMKILQRTSWKQTFAGFCTEELLKEKICIKETL